MFLNLIRLINKRKLRRMACKMALKKTRFWNKMMGILEVKGARVKLIIRFRCFFQKI